MAYDYAVVHLKFTIPLATLLTVVSYPLLTRVQLYKTITLILIAFLATLPWDAYLIRHNVWTYPPDAVLGPRLYGVPVEELFFFIVQTYITSLLYIILNKPLLHVQYLSRDPPLWARSAKLLGQWLLLLFGFIRCYLISNGGPGTYLGLILIWTPADKHRLSNTSSTLYLWIVDELALGWGTWSIESGTKLGICVWGSLDVEEAVFFLATNVLIVFGLAAFDHALAIIDAFPHLFPTSPECPSPALLLRALLTSTFDYDMERIAGIREAVERLRKSSRSFYLASSAFSGRLRVGLTLLYSFCRMADDLVDNSVSQAETASWIARLSTFLDMSYGTLSCSPHDPSEIKAFAEKNFPSSAVSALLLLPTHSLSKVPLQLLLDGFTTDALFSVNKGGTFPIKDEIGLASYATCVAGMVGEMCVSLIFHHSHNQGVVCGHKAELEWAAKHMGMALQYVNIARDIWVDAQMGRVYLPTTWLEEEGLADDDVVKNPQGASIERLKKRLLNRAFKCYREARPSMRWLPSELRRPMVVAVESYMEIGRVLLEKETFTVKPRTAPSWRRLRVAFKALLDVYEEE